MSRKSIISNLHRFSRLNDKNDTQVFTFVIPTQLTKGFVNEVYSESFVYRNQTWIVKFDRKERHIGSYLILKSTQNQLSCVIDYSFVVVNRDHFTKNESFSENCCEFSENKLCRGRPSFIEVSDLENRHFLYDDAKFLIELELKNCATIFNDNLSLIQLTSNSYSVESNYFTYAGCDWSVILKFSPQERSSSLPEFSLVRHSNFEHYCKVGYRISLKISPNWPELSASVEQQLDIKGYGYFFRMKSDKNIPQTPLETVEISLKLYSMHTLSIIDLMPTNRQKNAVRCYDMNQHDWMIQSDILGSIVKLRLFYMQIANVQRNSCHVICWDCQILPHSSQLTNQRLNPIKSTSGPYLAFFSQQESDEGTEISMNLAVDKVCDTKAGYVNPETGALSIQVEWFQSQELSCQNYHIYDELARIHKTQMTKEIKTLQSENYALEKQLYKYQQSLSMKKLSLYDDAVSDTASLGGSQGSYYDDHLTQQQQQQQQQQPRNPPQQPAVARHSVSSHNNSNRHGNNEIIYDGSSAIATSTKRQLPKPQDTSLVTQVAPSDVASLLVHSRLSPVAMGVVPSGGHSNQHLHQQRPSRRVISPDLLNYPGVAMDNSSNHTGGLYDSSGGLPVRPSSSSQHRHNSSHSHHRASQGHIQSGARADYHPQSRSPPSDYFRPPSQQPPLQQHYYNLPPDIDNPYPPTGAPDDSLAMRYEHRVGSHKKW